jgi:glycosyltransferase involved in cell wall biosynthesis
MEMTKAVVSVNDMQEKERSSEQAVQLSVVIPVSGRCGDLRDIYLRHAKEIWSTGHSCEFIFVLDGPDQAILQSLRTLKLEHPDIHVIASNRWFGEATALAIGLERSRGSVILTLPSYFQVEPAEIPRLLECLDKGGYDMVVAWRHPRIDSFFNRLQAGVFRWLVAVLTGIQYHDVSCGVRVMNRKIIQEVRLYGDLHRFLPILAYEQGFKVSEIPVKQSVLDLARRIYKPGIYLRRILDAFTLFFLVKFTKKPLRFFGLVGSGASLTGAAILGYLGLYRLLGYGAIAGRPLLTLGVLLTILGLQLFSIGLLGELIVFTHARDRKDYQIEEILE